MLHLNEFLREAFQGYVENVPPAREYLLGSFMPTKPTYDMKFAYNVIDKKYARTASITGFNAGAPLRDKDGLSRHFAEVAKVQHGFRLDEEELLKFHRPRHDAERDQAIEYVYDQTDNLINGVHDVAEWMRAQAIYKGKLEYSENDVQINVDFGIPAGNKLTATVKWDNLADSTPLKDLTEAVRQFKKANNNKKPSVIHMSMEVEADLLDNKSIRDAIFGNDNKMLMTSTDLQNVFTRLGLPAYQIQDDMIDNGKGAERLLPERRVMILGSKLGTTYEGPTVEKNYQPGIYVVSEIKETNPPQQAVFVGKTVFPALEVPSEIVWMDV